MRLCRDRPSSPKCNLRSPALAKGNSLSARARSASQLLQEVMVDPQAGVDHASDCATHLSLSGPVPGKWVAEKSRGPRVPRKGYGLLEAHRHALVPGSPGDLF